MWAYLAHLPGSGSMQQSACSPSFIYLEEIPPLNETLDETLRLDHYNVFYYRINLLLNVDGNPSLCGGGLKSSSGAL